jgi:hypothetical protein
MCPSPYGRSYVHTDGAASERPCLPAAKLKHAAYSYWKRIEPDLKGAPESKIAQIRKALGRGDLEAMRALYQTTRP